MPSNPFLFYRCLLTGFLVLATCEILVASPEQGSQEQGSAALSSYLLGPDDQFVIHALDAEEINEKPVRVGSDGMISLPMIGRMKVAGMTIEQVEDELKKRLQSYLQHPEISVSVHEFRSQTVSVIGSVKNPGTIQVRGQKRLVEILSLAGGIADDAGHSLKITRQRQWGPIPLPNSSIDSTGQFNIAEVNLKTLIDAETPEENIPVMPNDVISIPRGELVFVIGDVKKSGGVVLKRQDRITVLQALSLAEGLERTASPKKARILRSTPGAVKRTEEPVDLKAMLAGQANDVTLSADDILFVPGSKSRTGLLQTLQAVSAVAVTIAVW